MADKKEKQLFPKEFIQTSIEHYTFRLRKHISGIYLTILVSIFLLIAAAPFLRMDVTTLTSGIIDTSTQRFELFSTLGGRVVFNRLVENDQVEKGDTLILFDDSSLKTEFHQLKEQQLTIEKFLSDLEVLTQSTPKYSALQSRRFQIAFLHYQSQLDQLLFDKKNLKVIFDRQKKLLDQRVIATMEFEKDQANYQRSISEIERFKKQSKNTWKETAIRLMQDLKSLELRSEQLRNEQPKYLMLSPIAGELQNVFPLANGQYVQLGQRMTQITPDTTLLAVCWVSPQNIGRLKKGMEGSFRIDAFNFNDWGFIRGTIKEISSDVYLINEQPFFKVVCEIEKNHLQLKNGFVGHLKKGMTIQGSFIVANRSLYQLLYDKVDDWLNPNNL